MKHQVQNFLVRSGVLRASQGLHGVLCGHGVLILMGHQVRDDDDPADGLRRGQLAALIEYLQQHYRIVSLEESYQRLTARVREPLVVLTFDDGYADNHRNAWPVLRAYGAPATVFVATGLTGTRERVWTLEVRDWLRHSAVALAEPPKAVLEYLKRLPHDEREVALQDLRRRLRVTPTEATDAERMMTAEELRELAADPLITLGAHTAHHEILSRLPVEQARREIAESVEALAQMTGQRPRCFAYPNGQPGDYGAEHIAMLRELGFEAAVTTVEGLNWPGGPPFELRRIPLGTGDVEQCMWRTSILAHCAKAG